MARKAIKGYAEKNYYDNTRFNGGIVTSNDALNEGYFKHLVNFDIADTGQSLTPRKGFLTTTFKKDDITYIFNNKTIYFYDENIGEYIFVSFTDRDPVAYRCTFDDLEENKFKNISPIANIDITDIGENHMDISPITTNRAIRIVDEYNVTAYVVKVKANDNELWLKLYYRETGSDDFDPDTLVVSYLDMSQLVNYVDTNLRNIASSESIIPDPIQEIYEANAIPEGHYDRMPMMYVKQGNKYLINNVQNIEGIEMIPNFYIAEDVDTDYNWAYTYDIISTNKDLDYSSKQLIYKAPLFYVDTGLVVPTNMSLSDEIYATWNDHWKSYSGVVGTTDRADLYNVFNSDTFERFSYTQYREFLDKLKINTENRTYPEYVLYIVPEELPSQTYEINLYNSITENYLGSNGMLTHFSDTLIESDSSTTTPLFSGHNYKVLDGTLTHYSYCTYTSPSNDLLTGRYNTLDELLSLVATQNFSIVPRKITNISSSMFDADIGGYQDCIETVLNSNIITYEYEDAYSISRFKTSTIYEDIKTNSYKVAIKILPYMSPVVVSAGSAEVDVTDRTQVAYRLFPKLCEIGPSETVLYYIAYDLTRIIHVNGSLYGNGSYIPYTTPLIASYSNYTDEDCIRAFTRDTSRLYNSLFFLDRSTGTPTTIPLLYPDINLKILTVNTEDIGDSEDTPIFTLNENNNIIGAFNKNNVVYNALEKAEYFTDGLIVNFYLAKLPNENLTKVYTRDEILTKSAKLSIARQLIRTPLKPTTYIEYLTEEPAWIAKARESLSYTSLLGSHLVLYVDNKLFISKEGMQYYYIYQNMFEYPEPIVKVIQYKELLLVFTTQNLYAVYLEEVVMEVANGTNEDGSIKYVQQTSYEFRTQTVLYNLMVDKKYADAIQVYNQMVLFYSSDGQMFLIKPTAAITSDTRFSIQYFNKSANDILLNYKDYMQQRLQIYGIDAIIKDVEIKVSATLNYIKIFYNAPGLITYILIYDILNNRYYVYDTVAFTNVKYLHYIPTGELYITDYDPEGNGNGDLYFTIPYALPNETDNNVDISHYDNFNPYPIESEIDSGVLNLNNHLKKRFKDLHVIYKNLNANHLEFAIEVFVDDVPIITYIDPRLEIRSILGMDTLVVVDEKKTTQLVKKKIAELIKQTTLFDFTEYTSNKLITHRTNIVSKGKTFRTRLTFSSKGRYKIQGFGIIYKEHTV